MRRAPRFALATAAVALTWLACVAACGRSSVPAPRYVSHPTSALVEVPYPPPPARVELVPEQPREGAVWIDGEWTWQGRRWSWRPGRWVMPREGIGYAPWTTVRDASGTLYVAQGVWRDDGGARVDDPPLADPGKPTTGSLVNPEGEEVAQGPLLAPDATPAAPDAATSLRDAGRLDGSFVDVKIADVLLRPDAIPLDVP